MKRTLTMRVTLVGRDWYELSPVDGGNVYVTVENADPPLEPGTLVEVTMYATEDGTLVGCLPPLGG